MLEESKMEPNGKSFVEKFYVKRDAKEIRMEQELMAVDLERKIHSLMGGRRDLIQSLRAYHK